MTKSCSGEGVGHASPRESVNKGTQAESLVSNPLWLSLGQRRLPGERQEMKLEKQTRLLKTPSKYLCVCRGVGHRGWSLKSAASPLSGVGDPHMCLCVSCQTVELSVCPQVPRLLLVLGKVPGGQVVLTAFLSSGHPPFHWGHRTDTPVINKTHTLKITARL